MGDGTQGLDDGGGAASEQRATRGEGAARARQRGADGRDRLDVLNLVTNADSQFYREQVARLADVGVDSTTLAVPGDHEYGADDADGAGTRSPLDYVKFYPQVLREAFADYDLVHANYGLTAPAAIAQPSLPVVLSLWGSDLMGEYGAVSKWCARRVDEVIVMSEDMAAELDRDCHVIPHGIDLEQFRPIDRERARREIGWDEDAAQVLFPYPPKRDVKNYPRAERIVDRVRERVDGPVELQVASGIPHDLMPYYMNAADVLLLTSKREGSPNTVKEAMACDCPVVATDVGDVRERLGPVDGAAVGTTDDELVAATTRLLAAGEGADARRHVEHLSTERMAERIRDVYLDVLDR